MSFLTSSQFHLLKLSWETLFSGDGKLSPSPRHAALFSLLFFVIRHPNTSIFPLCLGSRKCGNPVGTPRSSGLELQACEVHRVRGCHGQGPSLVSVPQVLGWCEGCPEAVHTGVSTASSSQLPMACCWEPGQRKHAKICAEKGIISCSVLATKVCPTVACQQAEITCFQQFPTVEECFPVSRNNFLYWCLLSFKDKNQCVVVSYCIGGRGSSSFQSPSSP